MPAVLLLAPLALAADPSLLRPFGWLRPGGAWIADSDAVASDQDGFTLQARGGVDVQLPDLPVRARLEVDLLPEPTLKDAWVAVTPASWLALRAGQLKVPFSVSQLTSETRLQLPTPPRLVAASGAERDIGVEANVAVPMGGKTRLMLTSGAFNGEGANRLQNVNQRLRYVQRALITPLGARDSVFEGPGDAPYVGLGGGWIYDLDGDGDTAVETNVYGAELQASWWLWSVQAEAMMGDVFHANATVADYDVAGLAVMGSSFVPLGWARDHVELVGRWERVEPNTAFGAAEGEALPQWQAADVITAGLNVYARADATRRHDVKLQAAWTHPREREGAAIDDDAVTVVGTARF